jgi:hypothetical protein
VCAAGGIATAAVAFPMYLLLDTTQPTLVILAICAGVACQSVCYAVTGVLLAEMFPARVRTSGVSVSYNLSAVIGGLMPLIATSLLAASNEQPWSVALLLVAIALTTATAGTLAGHRRITEPSTPTGSAQQTGRSTV